MTEPTKDPIADPAAEVFLNDVEVPAGALIDGEGAGFMIAMKVFDRSRPGIAALAVGLIQRCLHEALGYAKTRRTMGKPIVEHQAIGHKLADMAVRGEAARLLTRQCAWALDAGQRNTLQAAYAKTFAADRQRIFIGSFNLDPRSVRLNTEMGVVLDSPRLASRLAGLFEDAIPRTQYEVQLSSDGSSVQWLERTPAGDVVHRTSPETGPLRRAWIGFLSLLPIDWML